MVKADNPAESRTLAERLFRASDLLLAQQFVYTAYDWRIGILAGQPLFACRYYMSRAHWQVVRHAPSGKFEEGGFEALPMEDVPHPVIDTALRLARLIGDGLYGVDLKETDAGVFVIEINDNPNLDAGIEDRILRDRLYDLVIAEFVRRLERRHRS